MTPQLRASGSSRARRVPRLIALLCPRPARDHRRPYLDPARRRDVLVMAGRDTPAPVMFPVMSPGERRP